MARFRWSIRLQFPGGKGQQPPEDGDQHQPASQAERVTTPGAGLHHGLTASSTTNVGTPRGSASMLAYGVGVDRLVEWLPESKASALASRCPPRNS